MADMVYSALRRKLAMAETAGDLDRIDRLRGMMRLPSEGPEDVPVEVPPEAPVDVPADEPEIDDPIELPEVTAWDDATVSEE